jgi:putative transposase
MRTAGLEGRCKRRWRTTTVPGADEDKALDPIKRHFGPSAEMDTRYVGDITYVWTWSGFAYMATVIDLASRRVVGWAVADHMRTKLVEDALHMAFARRRPARGVIFHSDRGSQYTSKSFVALARANGVRLSLGLTGRLAPAPPATGLPAVAHCAAQKACHRLRMLRVRHAAIG